MNKYQLFPDIKLVCGADSYESPAYGAVEVTYCCKGVREYRIGNGYYYLTAGNCIVNRNNSSQASDSVGFSCISVMIDENGAPVPSHDVLFDKRSFTARLNPGQHYIFSADSDVSALFSEISSLSGSSETAWLRIKLIELLMLISNGSGISRSSISDKILSVGSFICSNISAHYTIPQLSEYFKLNTTTLKSVFRQMFGCSVYAYAKNRKMFRTAELLSETSRKIIDIAADMGYNNASKFASAFNSVIGTTPRKYRSHFRMEQNIFHSASSPYIQGAAAY